MDKRKPVSEKTEYACLVCKNYFEAKRSHALTCSARCRQALSRKDRAARGNVVKCALNS